MKEKREDLSPVDVAVIGAGMAGLSTAVYARISGLSVRVFEKHSIPGGLCTSWKRSGYVFDYCIDYLIGTKKDQDFYDIWEELGVIDKTKFHHVSSFGRYVGSDGQVFNLYTDFRRLKEHMLEIAPEDEKKIKEFCGAIQKARRMYISELALSPRGIFRFVRSLPSLVVAKKWAEISLWRWCSELKNPFLKEALPALVGPVDFPMAGPIMVFALMSTDHVAYPLGGSLPLALAVEDKAKSLGAEFEYKSSAQRIIVEGGRAVGIELDDGRIQKARTVISACDARLTFDKLLGGKVRDQGYEDLFKSAEVQPSMIQVSLGVKIDPKWNLQELPSKVNLPLSRPIVIDGYDQKRLHTYLYTHDSNMAPDGGTVILVKYVGDYDYWKALKSDKENKRAYKAEKTRILTDTIAALEETFPGISSRIEAKDVATPTSCERYTNNYRGSSQGWVLTTEFMKKLISGEKLPKTFDGVDRFHLIGQWTEPGGGLPPAAKMGRDVIRSIMKSDGKRAAC